MSAGPVEDNYSKVEAFLDRIDTVGDPSSLSEPFRSLWFRIHGTRGYAATGGPAHAAYPVHPEAQLPKDVELAPSTGKDLEGFGREMKGDRIEIVSPKDVGPTVEMKVNETKVQFKMAADADLRLMKAKEDAANLMVILQKVTAPLKGLGGEITAIADQMRDVALSYRDGNYTGAIEIGRSMLSKLEEDKVKRSIVERLQTKVTDYQSLGGDLNAAMLRFKDLVQSFKEGKGDFLQVAGEVNGLAEAAIKDLVTEEAVAEVIVPEEAEVSIKEAPEPKPATPSPSKGPEVNTPVPAPAPKSHEKEAEVKAPGPAPAVPAKEAEVKAPAPAPAPAAQPPISAGKGTAEEKRLVKVVKKKLVPIIVEDEEEAAQAPEKAPAPEETAPPEKKGALPVDVQTAPLKAVENAPAQAAPTPARTEEKAPPQEAKAGPAEDPLKKEAQEAFNRIQVIYKASMAMHNKGKDVKQLFDLLNYAEQARAKGDMKTYIGVSKQLESMLISYQKGK